MISADHTPAHRDTLANSFEGFIHSSGCFMPAQGSFHDRPVFGVLFLEVHSESSCSLASGQLRFDGDVSRFEQSGIQTLDAGNVAWRRINQRRRQIRIHILLKIFCA